MAASWVFIYFVEGVFISSMLLLMVLIIRAKTPRRWIIEQITIKPGETLHQSVHIGRYSDFEVAHNDKMIDLNLLYRMPRTWWKIPYYFLMNIRARFAIAYMILDRVGIDFKPSKVPASIIEVADKSTAYTKALNSAFQEKGRFGGLIWVIVAFIIIILVVWGFKGGKF